MTTATAIMGSFVFLTTRHTWNKGNRKDGMLLLPEMQLYEVLQVQRRRLVRWARSQTQGPVDRMMQMALQISTSATGSLRAASSVVDAANRWSRINGDRSLGRYAVASTRTTANGGDGDDGDGGSEDGESKSASASSSAAPAAAAAGAGAGAQQDTDEHAEVETVMDSQELGVEIDLQIGQMTLRSRHLAALPEAVAKDQDVRLIFGETTMQASLLESATHCKKYVQ